MDTTQSENLKGSDTLQSSLSIVERLFVKLLSGLQGGSLRLCFPSGAEVVVGALTHSPVDLRVVDSAFFRKVFAGGSIGFGEAYVDGLWHTDDLSGLLRVLALNQGETGRLQRGLSWATQKVNRIYHATRSNTVERSRENIQEHYDLSNAFYQTFLDCTMTYSSALFEDFSEPLDVAQSRKIDRILDLAGVQSGDRILEIGSGWGGLALRAAERGCVVKTITLSEEQFAYAKDLFEARGLSDRIEIALEDYRHVQGTFDAVVSCEMIEAVGHEFLESYFSKIRSSLRSGGKAVLQAITIPDERYERYCNGCDWIQKYIFPGGHLPSPGEIQAQVLNAGGMTFQKSEGFGCDYAETLRRWSERFNASGEAVRALGFDEAFCRKWNYYLSYCEAGFDVGLIDVKHIVIERT